MIQSEKEYKKSISVREEGCFMVDITVTIQSSTNKIACLAVKLTAQQTYPEVYIRCCMEQISNGKYHICIINITKETIKAMVYFIVY